VTAQSLSRTPAARVGKRARKAAKNKAKKKDFQIKVCVYCGCLHTQPDTAWLLNHPEVDPNMCLHTTGSGIPEMAWHRHSKAALRAAFKSAREAFQNLRAELVTAPDVFKILRAELETGPEAFNNLKAGIKASLAHFKGANSSTLYDCLITDMIASSLDMLGTWTRTLPHCRRCHNGRHNSSHACHELMGIHGWTCTCKAHTHTPAHA